MSITRPYQTLTLCTIISRMTRMTSTTKRMSSPTQPTSMLENQPYGQYHKPLTTSLNNGATCFRLLLVSPIHQTATLTNLSRNTRNNSSFSSHPCNRNSVPSLANASTTPLTLASVATTTTSFLPPPARV